jgi:hypothetical protein
MSRLLFAISALTLTVTIGTAEARDNRGGSGSRSEFSHRDSDSHRDRDFHRDRDSRDRDFRGERFSYGYRFRGHDHNWSYSRWFNNYGGYCYYDSYTSCYYFWCQEDDCYYPTSYYSHRYQGR